MFYFLTFALMVFHIFYDFLIVFFALEYLLKVQFDVFCRKKNSFFSTGKKLNHRWYPPIMVSTTLTPYYWSSLIQLNSRGSSACHICGARTFNNISSCASFFVHVCHAIASNFCHLVSLRQRSCNQLVLRLRNIHRQCRSVDGCFAVILY